MALTDQGPVKFRFDSSQRKNHVLIFDSQRFVGKSSEWYFVRKNHSTRNETYRCVHCRGTHEKARRQSVLTGKTSAVATNPGARIIVSDDRFMISPDFPLGGHICNFEANENCNTHVVWSRRALLRANSELRLNPEKPKLKFQNLLRSIQNGEDEYSHLSMETRHLIIEQLTSKKGFDSRRRSFARNNSMALKRLKANLHNATEEQKASLYCFQNGQHRRKMAGDGSRISTRNNLNGSATRQMLSFNEMLNNSKKIPTGYACGMPHCRARFISLEERADHRSIYHPQMFFVDSLDEYEEYKRMVNQIGGGFDEVFVAANGEIVEPANVAADSLNYNLEEPTINDVECEVVCDSGDATRDADNATDGFLEQINGMLNQIRGYARMVARHPILRDVFYDHVQNLVDTCDYLQNSHHQFSQPGGFCLDSPSNDGDKMMLMASKQQHQLFDFVDHLMSPSNNSEMFREESENDSRIPSSIEASS